MKIIISPAKRMKYDDYGEEFFTKPAFCDEAKIIAERMAALQIDTLKNVLKTNDKLTADAYNMYRGFFTREDYSAAILSFDGIQYKYMAPTVFDDDMFRYVSENVYILSALYGALRPFDTVLPYRLEMNSPVKALGISSMYDFWGDKIANEIYKYDDLVLGLTSAEYTKSIYKYVTGGRRFVYVSFGELIDGKVVEKGVYVKMARGDMVRYLAENNISDIEEVKGYNGLGYVYHPELSNDERITFIKPQSKNIKGG